MILLAVLPQLRAARSRPVGQDLPVVSYDSFL